jgi:hypothetical protein
MKLVFAIFSLLAKSFLVSGFFLIQACAPKTLLVQDGKIDLQSRDLKIRGDESLSVSYLAKELVSKERQQITIQYFSESEKVKYWGESDDVISAMMIGDILEGSYGSSTGDRLGAAVFLASLLGPDGSRNWLDRVFLPQEIDGIKLESEADALKWVFLTVDSKIKKIVSENGWSMSCIKNCGENNGIYEISLKFFPKNSLYKPEKIYVFAYIRGSLKRASKNLLRDAALGFPVVWEDSDDAFFLLRLVSEPELTEDGKPVLEYVNSEKSYLNGGQYVKAGKNAEISQIGQMILQSIYNSPNFVKGYEVAGVRRVFHNGKVYRWNPYKAYDGFVREEVYLEH